MADVDTGLVKTLSADALVAVVQPVGKATRRYRPRGQSQPMEARLPNLALNSGLPVPLLLIGRRPFSEAACNASDLSGGRRLMKHPHQVVESETKLILHPYPSSMSISQAEI
ncbi:hypothetical protein EVJ50_06795 [Synechococcus sp. RSCCF101]|nr:hypothetical protein EVJ50_06795 [Synechococcus sp. RSCCF101]